MSTTTTITELELWPEGSPHHAKGEDGSPALTLYQPAGAKQTPGGIVLICPGGGYRARARHEGPTVAEYLNSHGIAAAVIEYRVAPHQFPLPYVDACRAVRVIRSRASELNVSLERVALLGFSAGGHLAATVATQPDLYHDPHDELAGSISARPNLSILGYPVISMTEAYHTGSAKNLLGPAPSEAQRLQMSNELHVTAANPPVFLFHTADDPAVAVSNSLRFAAACDAAKVPIELHVFRQGRHGVGLAADNPTLAVWPELMVRWLDGFWG